MKGEGEAMEQQLGSDAIWTNDQLRRFETAKDTLRALIAAYSARIADDHPFALQDLRDARTRHAERLRTLAAADADEIAEILNEYPALILQVRAGHDSVP
jgi:hypothetical protein